MDRESIENLRPIDFMFKFGVSWDAHTPTRLYLASFALLKGVLAGREYLVHVGAAPICMATGAFCFTALSIKYIPPFWALAIAPFLFFCGVTLPNAAVADYYKLTLDPFILAFLLKATAAALLFAAIMRVLRDLKTHLTPKPG
jgi:hypothetical protein